MPEATTNVVPVPVIVHDWDRMATLKLDNLPDAPKDPFDPSQGMVTGADRKDQILYGIKLARSSFDSTGYPALPGSLGCFAPINDGSKFHTCGNGDGMGFLSPDGWFYPAACGHTDCCRRLTKALMIECNIRGGPESKLMDGDGWVKFAVYGHRSFNNSDIYMYANQKKQLSKKQTKFLLDAIKAGREAGWAVNNKFELAILEGNIDR